MSTNDDTVHLSDDELASRLVGTWKSGPEDSATHASTATYNPDGTGVEVVSFPDRPQDPAVEVTTKWRIEDGILHLNSIASTDPQRVPVGLSLKDRIVSITDDRFEYAGSDGYGGYEGMREFKVRVR
jgi:hypothetical protein